MDSKRGPYRIEGVHGEGGMGKVYRARDTRLDRAVAIKFSHEEFSDRFEREARAVAALNHPNICTLYDVGPNYLVMELVEGPTLAERIQEGPIQLEEALVLMQAFDAESGSFDTWVLPQFGDRKPFPYFLKSEFSEKNAKFSPDGHRIAYVSDATGDFEVYLQSFPVPGNKLRVSGGGGRFPIWSRDGKELFFISKDNQMMAVSMNSRGIPGDPKPLFPVRLRRGEPWFDVSSGGRFLLPLEVESTAVQSINVI